MDFVSDTLFDGKKIRCLTIVDNYSRKCMAIHVGQSMKGYQVVEVLEELTLLKGAKPKKIQVDNGSEFISKEMDRWPYEQKVELVFQDLENQQIMRILGRSMGAFEMNV